MAATLEAPLASEPVAAGTENQEQVA